MNGFINYRKVLIVGLGMIGGSYAQKLSSLGFEVGALARRQETLDYALERGYIAHGQIEVTPEYFPADFIRTLVSRITTEVPGINRVLVDYTPKPPATVEYE